MKPRVFIDGKEGTTGLQIYERLGARNDIELLLIDDELRKDMNERRKLINSADIVFLCLPDAAAVESVSLLEPGGSARVIDASTAHRTNPGWAYGFPELSKAHREKIAAAKLVANPGCHATGFISTVYPLVSSGLLPENYPLTCFSLTGYSGGGKKMIAQYEGGEKENGMYSPRIYGLDLHHKHLPEMTAVTGLSVPPVFCPIVDDYYAGMATTVSLHNRRLGAGVMADTVRAALAEWYDGQRFVKVEPELGGGMLESNAYVGTNELHITVSGNDELTIVTARFDNLGKGASGAAVQNMNIMLGLPEDTGL